MEVWNPEHPHHAVWREYTQSLLDGKPKVVESKITFCQACFKTDERPSWNTEIEYRIARPMLKLSYEVPMPVTEALEEGQIYWMAGDGQNPAECSWNNDNIDNRWLRAGLIYLTEADAQAAIDARNAAMTAALEAAK